MVIRMNKNDIKAICDSLLTHDKILLIAHKNPDGDAVGSTAAMARLLEKAGKTVRIIYPDMPAERLRFILAGHEFMTPESIDSSFVPDYTVSLDCAASSRFGKLEEELADKVDMSVDHHLSNTPFAKATFTDAKASATSELVYDIAAEFIARGIVDSLDCDIAFPMYAGIASDTGNFKYSNTTAHTFNVCADLVETAIDIAEISRRLFDSSPLSKLKAEAIAINKLRVFADGKAAIIAVAREEVDGANLTYEDFDDAVNLARKVAGVEIGAYVREADTGEFKISLRANSYADVAALCARHAGGGHLRAAGCSIKAQNIYEAADIIIGDIENALK